MQYLSCSCGASLYMFLTRRANWTYVSSFSYLWLLSRFGGQIPQRVCQQLIAARRLGTGSQQAYWILPRPTIATVGVVRRIACIDRITIQYVHEFPRDNAIGLLAWVKLIEPQE